MKQLFAIALALFAGTVFAQAPAATSFTANLTWTLPATCTAAAPCTVNLYRWDGACPATGQPTTTSTNFVGTVAQATAYADTTVVSGSTYCYAAETVQGAAHSGPSNLFTLAIPGVGAPTLSGTTVTVTVTVAP